MAQETKLKNWIKPDFQYITESDLPKDAMKLPGCWVLADAREKPEYTDGNQMYKDDEDFLGPVLEGLRSEGLIGQFKHSQSRFNISPKEMEIPEVIAAIAEACGLEPEQISVPRMIEFNILGNIHHPEWGKPPSNCGEWFSDKYAANQGRLFAGFSDFGGFAGVNWRNAVSRYDNAGFRFLGRFK